jgi:hypothetical protein
MIKDGPSYLASSIAQNSQPSQLQETKLTLKQSWEDTSVETGNTTIGVECAERNGKAGSVTVLVIDLQLAKLKQKETKRT